MQTVETFCPPLGVSPVYSETVLAGNALAPNSEPNDTADVLAEFIPVPAAPALERVACDGLTTAVRALDSESQALSPAEFRTRRYRDERSYGRLARALTWLAAVAVFATGCKTNDNSANNGPNGGNIPVAAVTDNSRCNGDKLMPPAGGTKPPAAAVALTYNPDKKAYDGDPMTETLPDKVLGALVQVETSAGEMSGFLVLAPDGKSVYAVTAAHGIKNYDDAGAITITNGHGKVAHGTKVCFVMQSGTTPNDPATLHNDAPPPRYDIAVVKLNLERDKHGNWPAGWSTLRIGDDPRQGDWGIFANYQRIQSTESTVRVAGDTHGPAIYTGVVTATNSDKGGLTLVAGLDKGYRHGIYADTELTEGGSGSVIFRFVNGKAVVIGMAYASGQEGGKFTDKNITGVDTTNLTNECDTSAMPSSQITRVIARASAAFQS